MLFFKSCRLFSKISAQYPGQFNYKAETKPKLFPATVFGQNSANKRNKIAAIYSEIIYTQLIYLFLVFICRVTDSLHINKSCMH